MEKKRVLITVLAVDGVGQMDFLDLGYEAGKLSQDPECPFEIHVSKGENVKPAELAWNISCRTALEKGYDYLMFWDHDQEPPHNWVNLLGLIDSDPSYGVVAGDTLMWRTDLRLDHRLCHIQILDDGEKYTFCREPISRTNPFVLEGAVSQGAGMTIRREVLERLGENWFVKTTKPDGTRLNGADINFCRKVRDAGFKIVVDPRVMIDHCKMVRLFDIEELIFERVKEALEAREDNESQGDPSSPEENLPGVCVQGVK